MKMDILRQELTDLGLTLYVEQGKLKCRAAKGIVTPDIMKTLKRYKEGLLQALLQQPETYPLSYSQKAIWMLMQLEPENPAYNLMIASRAPVKFDLYSLEQAVSVLMERHPILRTTYNSTSENELLQTVHAEMNISVDEKEVVNWNGDQIDRWVEKEAIRPFDLTNGPVLRITVIQPSYTEANEDSDSSDYDITPILVLGVHHIAVDFWSFQILLEELTAIYNAVIQESYVDLPKFDVNYTDYISYQKTLMSSADGESSRHYWGQQLRGNLPLLQLPLDHQRLPTQTFNGRQISLPIDEGLSNQLRILSKQEGVTPFMMLLSAFQILLWRYTGQEDLLIGTPVAGRHLAGTEAVLGDFSNPIVFRNRVRKDLTLGTLLKQVQTMTLSAMEHQQFPFPALVEQLVSDREPNRPPIFQVMYLWHQLREDKGVREDKGELDNISQNLFSKPFPISGLQGAGYELMLAIGDAGGKLTCNWTYNTDLFDEKTINRFAQQFNYLLNEMVKNPKADIQSYSLSAETELLSRSVMDREIYILDSERGVCPIGVVGEIYVNDKVREQEYLGWDLVGQEAFIDRRISETIICRLFKTGEWGRILSDGSMEMITVPNASVWVNGFLVDVQEVESAVEEDHSVKDVVVRVRKTTDHKLQLVSYLVPGESYVEEGLRDRLQQRLPSYFIPRYTVLLAGLPLTDDGEIDEKNLAQRTVVDAAHINKCESLLRDLDGIIEVAMIAV